ncbi:MAG: isoleucine--tRNA ligase [Anaerolineae bacterium]
MFKPVSPRVNVQDVELAQLEFWREHNIMKRTMTERVHGPRYVFYEGPPTANGRPGTHHVLARAFKDLFPRYKTMRGYYVLRKAGWDTHGLPVEIGVEKELGIEHKWQIEEYGIAEFNKRCQESVLRYLEDWEELTDRIAFWVDMDEAYITFKNEYIQSVWWILRQFWDKGLIYRGHKVVPYCPRCGTPLSSHEVNQGYKDDVPDPSVFVRFKLRDEEHTYFLVWTTTPWTLPGNVALAVGEEVDYVKVAGRDAAGKTEHLILARDLLEYALGEQKEHYRVVAEMKGRDLLGRRYEPLYAFLPVEQEYAYVVSGSFVSTEEGTGIVHIAPAFGADDLEVGVKYGLPVLQTVEPDGTFCAEVTPWAGMMVKEADPHIIDELRARGLMFRHGTYYHTYPFCWRCDTPLLYYARPTWYIRTTARLNELVELNRTINWVPGHIRDGRFGNWLETNVDWALGRERYWGTPLPVWVCDNPDCEHQHCVGSVAELSDLAGRDMSDLELHRPYVDEVTWPCRQCGTGTMRRVPELIDVWFDSGAMPVAQWGYPFQNQELFNEQFPADFICEAIDQTRGWFYSLHAISTLLFNQVSFKNVICLGLILDEKGKKMSKSRDNAVDPWDVIDLFGADIFRWYMYTAGPPGEPKRFSLELVGQSFRLFWLTLWNTYSFFVTYANLDDFDPRRAEVPVERRSRLDRWILSELNALVATVTEAFETYDVPNATRPIERFVDNLSNWYLRRSRRRFWKGESDEDKAAAYLTLYECLTTVSKLLAPSMPFLAEEMYRNLVASVDANAPESVHLTSWPEVNQALIDEALNEEMRAVMRLVSLGHAARNNAQIKVRQPLAEVAFSLPPEQAGLVDAYADLIADELNVKRVRVLEDAGDLMTYTLHPQHRLLGPRLGKSLPAVQKALQGDAAAAYARMLLTGQNITVSLGDETVELTPEEVSVRSTPPEGYAAAEEGSFLALLDTRITPDLAEEGLAREFIRRVQVLRRDADFNVDDRIVTTYHASEGLARAVERFADLIRQETLSDTLQAVPEPAGEKVDSFKFDGETLTLGVARRR